jgi:hypothetical protein
MDWTDILEAKRKTYDILMDAECASGFDAFERVGPEEMQPLTDMFCDMRDDQEIQREFS